MRGWSRRRALDPFFFLPRRDVNRLALHACGHALVRRALEADCGACLWNFAAKQQVVSLAGLGIRQNVAAGFHCFFDTA